MEIFNLGALILFSLAVIIIIYTMFRLGQMIHADSKKYLSCEWEQQEPGLYKTKCGRMFQDSTESGSIKSWGKHCIYCSRLITEKHQISKLN